MGVGECLSKMGSVRKEEVGRMAKTRHSSSIAQQWLSARLSCAVRTLRTTTVPMLLICFSPFLHVPSTNCCLSQPDLTLAETLKFLNNRPQPHDHMITTGVYRALAMCLALCEALLHLHQRISTIMNCHTGDIWQCLMKSVLSITRAGSLVASSG